jgi:ParB family transcriptional regulator, chromosome partitioning protein
VFRAGKPGDWERLERELSDLVGCTVAISLEKEGRGELRVAFHSLDELDGVIARLGYPVGS